MQVCNWNFISIAFVLKPFKQRGYFSLMNSFVGKSFFASYAATMSKLRLVVPHVARREYIYIPIFGHDNFGLIRLLI